MAAVFRPRPVVSTARHVPYAALVDERVVRTVQGDLVQTLRLSGASFESADDASINRWHEQLNALWRNVASPQVAFWAHVIRRREQGYPAGACAAGFAAELDAAYRQRLAGETLMVNELYLTLVVRPHPSRSGTMLSRLLGHADSDLERAALADALDLSAKLRAQLGAALAEYEPEWLGVESGGGRRWSVLLEFLGLLVNGERQRWPLPASPLYDVLGTTRPLFGGETIECGCESTCCYITWIGCGR